MSERPDLLHFLESPALSESLERRLTGNIDTRDTLLRYLMSHRLRTGSGLDPWLSQLSSLREESLEEKLNTLHEHILLESISPAFDDVPLRRIFPFYVYAPTLEPIRAGQLSLAISQVIEASACSVVRIYPELSGSSLSRATLQTRTHQTRSEFESSSLGFIEQLAKISKENGVPISLTIDIGQPSATEPNLKVRSQADKSQEWPGKLKDFTEALRNLVLTGVGVAVLFGGTVISSEPHDSGKETAISVESLSRAQQLRIVPKILEAHTPEEFLEALHSDETSLSDTGAPSIQPRKSTKGHPTKSRAAQQGGKEKP